MKNDISIYTIQNGNEKTKEQWIEDFKKIGIDVPKFVLDYDVDSTSKQMTYYTKNKDKLNKKFTCKCSGKYTKQNKFIHLKSLKHKNYLASLASSSLASFQSAGLK